MSNVFDVNEDAVRAYAGKKPADVVGICISAKKPFTDVERAYCSQYFAEQFALIDADESLLMSYKNDPAFEGLDPEALANGDFIPAYAQERKDMYDNVDCDFAGRAEVLFDEFVEASDMLKKSEQFSDWFPKGQLVDDTTLRTLRDNGLPYSATLEYQDSPYTPSQLVKATLEGGDYKLQWADSYACDKYVKDALRTLKSDNGVEAQHQFEALLDDVKSGQMLLNDKTPAYIKPYSVLSYTVVQELREAGFDYGIKGMSAESLCDVYELMPKEMVACAEDAGINWDETMRRRMDSWIMNNGPEQGYDKDAFVDYVLEAERMAGASTSAVFEQSVSDGVFANGSKVQLYSHDVKEILDRAGYEERSKVMFDDYLKGMAERHVKQPEAVSYNDRKIENAPEFMDGGASDSMQFE